MFLRILSLGGPFWVYVTFLILLYGIYQERKRFDWLALVPAAIGLIASAFFLAPVHRIFFDEDIYINVGSNLTHAPVNQFTMLGGPNHIEVSTYQKEPVGWPVLLSFAFLAARPTEAVAFWFARILFAAAIAAVYHLARSLLQTRTQALLAAALFGATPVCFWYSVSAGTDITAALMAVLGMWGLAAGNGALAAAGFAFAAQTRMELLLLIPLVWISPNISRKWKMAAGGLALFEIVHVAWVMSVASVLNRAEQVPSAFGIGHVTTNLPDNIKYLFNPFSFPIMVSVFANLSLWERAAARVARARQGEASSDGGRVRVSGLRQILQPSPRASRRPLPGGEALVLWVLGLFTVYLLFYAGSFDGNPRYSIQIIAPLVVLATSLAKRPVWIAALLVSAAIPAMQSYQLTPQGKALVADHQLAVQFASGVKPDDLIISGVQEVFIDNGRRAINASFASTIGERLKEEMRKSGKVWYHSGVRATLVNSDEWRADRWVKSNFELHLIESHEVGGLTIAFYEVLANRINREARQLRSFIRNRSSTNRRLI